MTAPHRRAAIDEYKNRKPRRGVFAVRCTATGHVWVGASPNLEAARNGTWFTLRANAHRDAALQAEWRAHGEETFRYDVLEELDPDALPMSVSDLLKEKKREWASRERAPTLLP